MLRRPSIFSARHPATGSKPSKASAQANTASASTTNGICFVWTHNGPAEVEIVDYH